MSTYIQDLNSVTGAGRNVARLADVLGAASPETTQALAPVSGKPSAVAAFLQDIRATRPRDVPDGLGTLAGAVVGGYLYRGTHPVLGIIGGASLGRNLPAMLRADDRRAAARNLITTGGAIVGSVLWKAHPALGFLAGLILGGGAAYYGGLNK